MNALPKCYPSNLALAQWNLIAPYLTAAKAGGRPRSSNLQTVLNAISATQRFWKTRFKH